MLDPTLNMRRSLESGIRCQDIQRTEDKTREGPKILYEKINREMRFTL